MGLKSDTWIRKQSDKHHMIVPFEGGVIRNNQQGHILSYGTSSYGYDLRLSTRFKVFTNLRSGVIDPKEFDGSLLVDMDGDTCIVPPGGLVLAHSEEYLRMPKDVLGLVVAKTTYARCGINLSSTPLEPGWHGHVALPLANTSPLPVRLHAGEGIAQVLFFQGDEPCDGDYLDRRGRYHGQRHQFGPKV